MNNQSPSFLRLTTTSHFLTALIFGRNRRGDISAALSARRITRGRTNDNPFGDRSFRDQPRFADDPAFDNDNDPSPGHRSSSDDTNTTPHNTASDNTSHGSSASSPGRGCGRAQWIWMRSRYRLPPVHAAPGFSFECPGWADGHQAMSCDNVPGVCPGTMVIAISIPCPAAYMNEASNSWVLLGKSDAPLDPYGYCQ